MSKEGKVESCRDRISFQESLYMPSNLKSRSRPGQSTSSVHTAKSSLSPLQIASLGTVLILAQRWAWLVLECSLKIQWLEASFKVGVSFLLIIFQGMLGLMGATSMVPVGLLDMRPLQYWLKAYIPTNVSALWPLGRPLSFTRQVSNWD